MKSKLILLGAMTAVVFSAWLGGDCKREAPGESVSLSVLGKTVYPKDPLETWLAIIEIWKCEGGYEVKTSMSVIGEYETLEAARAAKTNRAQQALEAQKRGDFDFKLPVRPDCKRVE